MISCQLLSSRRNSQHESESPWTTEASSPAVLSRSGPSGTTCSFASSCASPKLRLACIFCDMTRLMPAILRTLLIALSRSFRSRRDLVLENLALRQQLVVLAAKHPRPRFFAHDRLFWVILRRCWTGWKG